MTARFAIVVFPGTWSDTDCFHAFTDALGQEAEYVFHKETDLSRFDCVVLPGGFSYGDYLRPGAIARFSPVMGSVTEFAREGRPVIGICNGFQMLCEAGLLPGALLRNRHLQFRCEWTHLRVEHAQAPFTSLAMPGQTLAVPISHGDGNYFADDATLAGLEANGQVAFRYATPDGAITDAANPNGSRGNIAGITNAAGNVLGMMPHPERAVEEALGGTDGLIILRSIADAAGARAVSARASA